MLILKKIFGIFFNVCFYAFIAFVIAFVLALAGGIRPYITMSGSMEPSIQTGSICFVNTKAVYSEIQEGDIIAFMTANGRPVTHRVISISADGIETKGDANEVSDGITTNISNFHGETICSIPYIGYVVKYLQQPALLGIFGVVSLTIYIASRVISNEAKKEKANAEAIVVRDEMQGP